jgi:hypothetical protein
VQCHNASTTSYYSMTRTDPVTGAQAVYKIPTLDLSTTPVTVYYDRKVATWPSSYVSIFYPATVSMGDSTGKITIAGAAKPCTQTGLTPAENGGPAGCTPWWGIPGSARASALTEKINLHGIVNGQPDGSTAWPVVAYPMHPEDQGVTLTDDERKTLAVYPMDLGGQYWARQNTGFVPYTNGDPVTPSAQ